MYKEKISTTIKQKDKIFHSIQKDQKKRYDKLLSQLQNDSTIQEFEIVAIIEVYDGLSENLLLTLHSTFSDQLYTINIFGIELKVCLLTYSIIENLGVDLLQEDLIIWADVNVKHQKYFNCKRKINRYDLL